MKRITRKYLSVGKQPILQVGVEKLPKQIIKVVDLLILIMKLSNSTIKIDRRH